MTKRRGENRKTSTTSFPPPFLRPYPLSDRESETEDVERLVRRGGGLALLEHVEVVLASTRVVRGGVEARDKVCSIYRRQCSTSTLWKVERKRTLSLNLASTSHPRLLVALLLNRGSLSLLDVVRRSTTEEHRRETVTDSGTDGNTSGGGGDLRVRGKGSVRIFEGGECARCFYIVSSSSLLRRNRPAS
jgi:hypothetical protein